jgi:hypothetical protein
MTQTRGERSNNPGNIRHSDITWLGEISSLDAFADFKSPEYGIRAIAKVLLSYQRAHGLDTVRKIISRWAPPSENDTSAYIAAVAAECCVDPDMAIDLRGPTLMGMMVKAIIRHENGRVAYDDSVINDGVALALA